MAGPAFQFHRLRSRLDEAAGIYDCLVLAVVSTDGQIRHEQRSLHPARRRPGVVEHFLKFDLGRVGVTQHNHA